MLDQSVRAYLWVRMDAWRSSEWPSLDDIPAMGDPTLKIFQERDFDVDYA